MASLNLRSINVRLITIFVVIVTTLLAVLGAVNYYAAKTEQEQSLADDVAAAQLRIQTNVATPLWNFDTPVITATLQAELGAAYIQSISVRTPKGWSLIIVRDKDGKAVVAKEAPPTAAKVISQEGDVIYKEGDKSQTIGRYTLQYSRAGVDAALSTQLWHLLLQIVILDVALVVALGTALRIVVIRPLNGVRDALRNIAEGEADLTRRISEKSGDEFAEVAHWFNTFVTRIQGVIQEVGLSVAEQLDASRKLNSAAETVSEASKHQADAVQSTAASIEEVSVSVSHIADNTQNVEQETRQAAHSASTGAQSAQRGAEEIRLIARAITQVSDTITTLAKRSDEIGGIVNVIKDIADQTNLLALNAAIEAARAGEQGRGFAVVADEVRKLAERTTIATQEINNKIEAVQRDTSQAVVGMNDANQKVEQGVRTAQDIADVLREIEGQATGSVEVIASISSAVKEQSAASQEIARHIERIAQSSEETQAVSATTHNLAGQLSSIAAKLNDCVHRFTV